MTREEAIRILQDAPVYLVTNDGEVFEKFQTARIMAIEALKAQTITNPWKITQNTYVDGFIAGRSGRWTPCIQELPKVPEHRDWIDVLITEKHIDGYYRVRDGFFIKNTQSFDYAPDYTAIAWMPLPEPYKE